VTLRPDGERRYIDGETKRLAPMPAEVAPLEPAGTEVVPPAGPMEPAGPFEDVALPEPDSATNTGEGVNVPPVTTTTTGMAMDEAPADVPPALDAELAEVPDGTADEVLAWVDDDPDRAAQALAVERARDKPRSTLAGKLERLAEPG
jgi:hypothetical protein